MQIPKTKIQVLNLAQIFKRLKITGVYSLWNISRGCVLNSGGCLDCGHCSGCSCGSCNNNDKCGGYGVGVVVVVRYVVVVVGVIVIMIIIVLVVVMVVVVVKVVV